MPFMKLVIKSLEHHSILQSGSIYIAAFTLIVYFSIRGAGFFLTKLRSGFFFNIIYPISIHICRCIFKTIFLLSNSRILDYARWTSLTELNL